MHPSARGPRKNASQTAMSNQQTVDIFKLIRDSPSATAMQEPIDTIPSSAWKSCCAYRFFFPQPQNLTSPNLWISSTAPIELQDCFQPLSLNFWRVILRISPHSRRTTRLTLPNNEPSHLLIVKNARSNSTNFTRILEDHTTYLAISTTPPRASASAVPHTIPDYHFTLPKPRPSWPRMSGNGDRRLPRASSSCEYGT